MHHLVFQRHPRRDRCQEVVRQEYRLPVFLYEQRRKKVVDLINKNPNEQLVRFLEVSKKPSLRCLGHVSDNPLGDVPGPEPHPSQVELRDGACYLRGKEFRSATPGDARVADDHVVLRAQFVCGFEPGSISEKPTHKGIKGRQTDQPRDHLIFSSRKARRNVGRNRRRFRLVVVVLIELYRWPTHLAGWMDGWMDKSSISAVLGTSTTQCVYCLQ
mmetsp:Transcript_108405/g.221328  ORF Transcript_108405/g.221328 Transcript_108405/m.221328 type:complete len:215 (+) Transcript_108405:2553-3197(+)